MCLSKPSGTDPLKSTRVKRGGTPLNVSVGFTSIISRMERVGRKLVSGDLTLLSLVHIALSIARLNSMSSRARPFVPCRSRNLVLSPLAAVTGSRLSGALAIGGCDRNVDSTLGTEISLCLDRLR